MSSCPASDIADERVADVAPPVEEMPPVLVAFNWPSTGKGVSHTSTSIARGLGRNNILTEFFAPFGSERGSGPYRVRYALPSVLRLIPFKRIRRFAQKRNEAAFLSAAKLAAVKTGAIAYMWPDILPENVLAIFRELRAAGIPIVHEMINCHVGTAKYIIDKEYDKLGVPNSRCIRNETIQLETKFLNLSDYVFCPSALVEKSVVDHGVPESKIVSTSFGWDPDRMRGDESALRPIDGVTFLFVGSICVRKGAHLLLRYWAKSGIRGRLVMVGQMEPAIGLACAEYLRRDDVLIVNYTSAVRRYYRSADVFVFPSIEEGGVLVTHEAAGCGLPLIVSPMGAARVANESTGFVLDPHDEDAWIETMRRLAKDAELRRSFGSAAQLRAEKFTWSEVSKARAETFREIARNLDA
jgi:glycosyltransferase involved in cell wall biosynthesis